jgi:hypothetical protein
MRKILTIAIVLTAFLANAQSTAKKEILKIDSTKSGLRFWGETDFKQAAHILNGSDTLYIDDTTRVKVIDVNGHSYKLSDLGKKDSVAVPIYIFDKIDTSKQLTTVIVEGKKGRLFKTKGYQIYTQQLATSDGKNFQPISQPALIGALDEKRRPIKIISQ